MISFNSLVPWLLIMYLIISLHNPFLIMAVSNNYLAKSLKNLTISSHKPDWPAPVHHALKRKKMWASRGVPEVKFVQQEDTPGASRAIGAEFNGSRNDHREAGPKPGIDYFVAVLILFLLSASIEMQHKVSVRRSLSVQVQLRKILPSHENSWQQGNSAPCS